MDREKLSGIVAKGADIAGAFALNITNKDMKQRTLLITQALNPNCKKFSGPKESVTYYNSSGSYLQIWYRYKEQDYTLYMPYVVPKTETLLIATKDQTEEILSVQPGIGQHTNPLLAFDLKAEYIGADKVERRVLGAIKRF